MKQKRWRWFLLPIISITFAALIWRLLLWSKGATPSNVLWLGHNTVWTIAGATRTEAFRLDPNQSGLVERNFNDFKPGQRHIGPYLVVGKTRKKGQEFTSRLAAEIFKNFDTSSQSFSSCFQPGVAFRMWQGEQSLDVVLCFECNEVRIWTNEPRQPGKPAKELSGGMVLGRMGLLHLVKEAFPDDQALQSLTDTHR